MATRRAGVGAIWRWHDEPESHTDTHARLEFRSVGATSSVTASGSRRSTSALRGAVCWAEVRRPEMARQESQGHHYVPRFLLKPWAADGVLNGFWWNTRKGRLDCKQMGTRAFCYEIDLLTLQEHELGRDALESVFFGSVDTRGSIARDRLLKGGSASLNIDQRCDFARLLLSLEARRPEVVRQLRDGRSYLAEALDSDSEILHAMETEGLSGSSSAYVEKLGISLGDRALSNIQQLVDNKKIGGRLINSHWRIVHLGPGDGSLVLSDRPLVRLFGYEHPKASWFLPLGPRAVFCAANCPKDFDRLTPRKLARSLNVESVRQVQKYAFCVDGGHNRLLEKHLPPRDRP